MQGQLEFFLLMLKIYIGHDEDENEDAISF
jgi:hypothetical protein